MTTHQTRFKFTQASLKTLLANETIVRSTDKECSDKEISNLKIIEGKLGQKRYLLRYTIHPKKRSITIGKFPEIKVSEARKIARKHITLIASVVDPKQERENHKQMPTLDQFINESYFPFIKQKKRSFKHEVQRYTDYVSKRFDSIPYGEVKAINIQRYQMDMLSGDGIY